VAEVAAFFRGCATNGPSWIAEAGSFLDDALRQHLCRAPTGAAVDTWPLSSRAGVYRREHASLLIRSRTTGILVDPISYQANLPYIGHSRAAIPPELVQAIAITHQHADHWSLATILSVAPGPEIPVIVPRVAKTSLLAPENLEDSLTLVGQRVIAAAWYTTVRIGDIDVDILPFYGEQPTRDAPGAVDGVRNWGNCYRFRAPEFSTLLVVDGGIDPAGSMIDVAEESNRRHGPVDVVLACMREFASPFFGGLWHYWAPVPFGRLQELYVRHKEGTLPSTTAGARVLAHICRGASARYFLPYANGFEGIGAPVTDIGWGAGEPSERDAVASLRAELAVLGARTVALNWNPGDIGTIDHGVLTVS
jgi:L-ascorbate metabolism protein UlaG (beta-lactamase superfamily)